jgi:hypothetical protein
MNLRSVATPRAAHRSCGLAGLGLIVLAAMPFSNAAADPPADPAAKPAAEAAKPADPPTKQAKQSAAPAAPAECVRTGQRVIAALARDDTGAASQFFAFYNAFKCAPPHLAQAFACLVKLQAANPGLSNPSPEQVAQCWNDPATVPKVLPPPPPAPQQ